MMLLVSADGKAEIQMLDEAGKVSKKSLRCPGSSTEEANFIFWCLVGCFEGQRLLAVMSINHRSGSARLRAKVQTSLDDHRPSRPHDQVMEALRKIAEAKRGANASDPLAS